MTPITSFKDKKVALFGLGGSGFVSAQALVAGGANVSVWDDKESARDRARDAGLNVVDLHDADWKQFSSFVLAPGVPLTHPEPHWSVKRAKEAGVEIIGDIELFCRERNHIAPRSLFVAITGTNGKSTTTALVAHLFSTIGLDVQIGGNIGTPILALEPPADNRVHVIECSSFQIDLTPSINPWAGVLLNVTPDHLDRHGTMENYAAIKERLVAGAENAVVCLDDDICVAIAERLKKAKKPGTSVSVTHDDLAEGIVLDGTKLVRHIQGHAVPIADLAGIHSLRGKHNAQNAAAAIAALGPFGLNPEIVKKGLETFPGLPHRMEEVGRLGKILFVNDSKATNADAAEKALLSFEQIFWIIGGRAKEGGIEPLRSLFPKVVKAYLVGEATELFAETIGDALPYERCGTLDIALLAATRDAEASLLDAPVVLLSPACASFDQFPDFEKRGDYFRGLVKALLAERQKV